MHLFALLSTCCEIHPWREQCHLDSGNVLYNLERRWSIMRCTCGEIIAQNLNPMRRYRIIAELCSARHSGPESPDKASRTCRLRFGVTFLHFGQIGAIPFTDEFEGSWDQGIHRLADLSSRMILIMSWNERWCFASSRTTPQCTTPDNDTCLTI